MTDLTLDQKCDSAIEQIKQVVPFTGFSKRQILQVFGTWNNYSLAVKHYVKKYL